MPFEALWDEDKARYLLEDFTISYSPSATMFVQQYRKRIPEASQELLLMAPVNFPGEDSIISKLTLRNGTSPLPGTKLEASRLEKLFQSKSIPSEMVLHENATEHFLKSKDLSKVRFLHLATHGVANEKYPENSCLVLLKDVNQEEDGILYSGEIYGLNLQTELVVLSACETGLGQLAKGEGVIGLMRGFLFAGTQSLLVSLWSVQDESTTDLVTEFYTNFLNGKSKSQALREAKLSLLKNPKTNSPWHWASFVLVGVG